jgi:cytochrome P450
MLLILGGAIQRDPRYFSSPNTFDPDRFLRPDFHPDSKSAYMPFEKGPRDCIGQQLAILEMKITLVLTLRYFDFETCYKEDAVKVEGWGDEAYVMKPLSGKPKDFLPMRVTLREN